MNADELKTILEQHKLWLEDNGGERADLRWADLRGADLQGANLRRADLQRANLQCADLRWANLQLADLQGADLDYSCLPLWCGSKSMVVDKRIAAQIAAHFCALDCDDADYLAARAAILEFAKTSHRASDLGLLEGCEK